MAYYKVGNSFVWFMGRVSDIDDPERMGRVKVRIIHKQTGKLGKKESSYGITDEDLLWAWPISAIQSASLSWKKVSEEVLENFDTPSWIDAVGLSPTGIAVGTYVFGFFLDGHEQNIPMIFGTYHKMSVYPEPPSEENAKMLQLNAPTNPRYFNDVAGLARAQGGKNNDGQTLPKEPYTKAKTLKETNEPKSAYKTKYPNNTTYTTKSGHAIEIDDTPGHERIHIWHNSGSYEEIANDTNKFKGRRVKKTTHSDYEIVLKDKNILIQDNKNEEIGKNLKIEIGKDGVINIEGKLNISVKETINIKAPGGVHVTEGSLVVSDGNIQASSTGATGTFQSPSGDVITVQHGIVTQIAPP